MLEVKTNKPCTRATERKTPVWVPATGSPKTRIKKAIYYMKHKAWVPVDPREGGKAIMIVVCNLRRYHRLSPATTLSLIRQYYNPRCKTRDGHDWGWSDPDILKKFRQAGRRGMYPTLGVADPKAKKRAAKLELMRQLKTFWKAMVLPGGSCTPSVLREAFVRFSGSKEITSNMFSRVVRAVTGYRTLTPFGKKTYRGFHVAEMDLGVIQEKKEIRMAA